jgi:DnaJ-class molecular chaperone
MKTGAPIRHATAASFSERTIEGDQVAKTNTRLDKRNRPTGTRKTSVIPARKPSEITPDSHAAKGASSPSNKRMLPASQSSPFPDGAVTCLRCEGTGRLTCACNVCGGRGTMAIRCRKCSGSGTYTQEAGPCARCEATGVLVDGTRCPRCKGHKIQMAFSTPCAQCSGSGSFNAPCKKCGGSLHFESICITCNGTGCFQRK